jgi:hypothetical protein
MLVERVGLIAEHLHVEEVRLVDPVAGIVLLPAVDGHSQLEHCGPGRQMPQLGIAGQATNDGDAIDVTCHLYSSSCERMFASA